MKHLFQSVSSRKHLFQDLNAVGSTGSFLRNSLNSFCNVISEVLMFYPPADGIPTMYSTNEVLESQTLFSSDVKESQLVVENIAKS